jgi:predicted ATPase/class 3 adenylate cyclase
VIFELLDSCLHGPRIADALRRALSIGQPAFGGRWFAGFAISMMSLKEKEDAQQLVGAPTGTVTFLFTDIEGSTKKWERSPEAMSEALVRHDEILRTAIEDHSGYVFKTVGDAFCAAFSNAPDALEASLIAQRTLLSKEGWPAKTGPLRARMALHTGSAEERAGDYFGPPLNRVARLLSAGYGGQVLLSLPAQELVRDRLPKGAQLRDLGERRLKDLFRPERVFQLIAPELPDEFPPLKTLDTYRNNLPTQATPLIGREREVEAVCERLRSPEVRLLTLTGPGGTGKTRLGLQAAAELLEDYENGVFFASLAAVSDPALVTPTVAGVLGVKEAGSEGLLDKLKEYLRDKRMLLVLDNFEHLLEAAPMATELLGTAPGLKVLATSRTPLRLYGEHEFAVPPLALPDPRRPQPLGRLAQYEAVRLFIERARAVKVDFSVTNENAPAVAEICARLDGLPLAIELAAARIRLLPPQAMLARLSDRLRLLTGGARDLPERHRTLRATIEWSYALLDPAEQMLFLRLAVFAGGRTLEAMEAVCNPGGELELLEGVETLLENNLLRREEGVGEEPRFLMLETVHDYAREKLEESGEAEAIKRVHAEYFLTLAEGAAWLADRMEDEHDNLRAALTWALEREEGELGLRLAGALLPFWSRQGHWSEGRRWIEAALAKGRRSSAGARVNALNAVGWLAMWQGDINRASSAAEEGLLLSREVGDAGSVAINLRLLLGWTAELRADYKRATKLFEESLQLGRKTGDQWSIGAHLLHRGDVELDQEHYERAEAFYEEGVALSRGQGYTVLLADTLVNLGYAALLQGDQERATALNEEALTLYRGQGFRNARLEFPVDNLGWAALLRGDHKQAKTLHRESLVLCRELGNKLVAADSLQGLACVAGFGREDELSARLFGAADTIYEAQGISLLPAERKLREPHLTNAHDGPNEAAYEEGRKMTFEEATEYALSKSQSASSSPPSRGNPHRRDGRIPNQSK